MSKDDTDIIQSMRIRMREVLDFLESEEPADQEHIEWMKSCIRRSINDLYKLQEPH